MKIIYIAIVIFITNTNIFSAPFLSFDKNFIQAQSLIENAQYASFDSINNIYGYAKTGNYAYFILESFKDFATLYIAENNKNIQLFLQNSQNRIQELEKNKFAIEAKYVAAELHFHLAILKLIQGERMEAFSTIMQSYKLVDAIENNKPDFLLHRKLLGIYHIGLGYMPNYVLKFLKIVGLKGDIKKGLQELETCNNTKFYFYNEVNIIKTTLAIFSKNSNNNQKEIITPLLPNRFWYNYVLVLMNKKLYKNEAALQIFENSPKMNTEIPIFAYQKACLLLNKLKYKEASALLHYFITQTQGKNYIKDAWYKLYICDKISNQKSNFESSKLKIKQSGVAIAEVDKKAQKFANLVTEPHTELVKSMLLMDGGYFAEAELLLKNIKPNTLIKLRHQTEYYYRFGRIAEMQKNLKVAEQYYLQTIDIQGVEQFYFAPNACLQLAIMYQKSNPKKAITYCNKVLTYKKHEYKNSLDTKAKIALKQLNGE